MSLNFLGVTDCQAHSRHDARNEIADAAEISNLDNTGACHFVTGLSAFRNRPGHRKNGTLFVVIKNEGYRS